MLRLKGIDVFRVCPSCSVNFLVGGSPVKYYRRCRRHKYNASVFQEGFLRGRHARSADEKRDVDLYWAYTVREPTFSRVSQVRMVFDCEEAVHRGRDRNQSLGVCVDFRRFYET